MKTILLVLQAMDLLTTLYILSRGGAEKNPALVALQGLLGRKGAIVAAKLAVVAAVLFLEVHPWALTGLAILYVGVVAWNLYQVARSG